MNFIDLAPFSAANGSMRLPGSKSISNRVLLLAALADGCTTIHNLLASDDTRYMREALQMLGIRCEQKGESVCVEGCAGRIPVKDATLYLGNAGTAFRSLTAVLALADGHYRLEGNARMHERPIADLVDGLLLLGADIQYAATTGFPPLLIRPAQLRNQPRVQVRGDVSSQFLSGLLLALPLCGQAYTLEVCGELISKPYVAMTLAVMARFGVDITHEHWQRFFIPADARYRSPSEFYVEGDASSASYFLALGALAGGTVRVEGVGSDSIQGDVQFAEVLATMGAKVEMSAHAITVSPPASGRLQARIIDGKAIPDAAMTFATLALFAEGQMRINNIASWRVKETDRLAAMQNELRKLGARVECGDDYIQIDPPNVWQTPPNGIDTYDDHRMAMCFSLVAMAVPVRINDPDCVRKTFPDYFARLAALTTRVPVITIDGPSASGKGTVAARVAAALGWHYLDSGALYRLTALAAQQAGVSIEQEAALAHIAANLPVEFTAHAVYLHGKDVSCAMRTERISVAASQLAALPLVRAALLFRQRALRVKPGLVADGRDMGSVVFPDAQLKVFLTARVEIRAQRRFKQLSEKGNSVNITSILQDLRERDARDSQRSVAPLQQEEDAHLLDTSALSIEDSIEKVLRWHAEARASA